MNRINNTTIGLDIAKNVFHYAELNRNGTVTGSGVLKRNKVQSHFAGLESTTVVMEACAGSHYWGRQLQDCNHEVILLPAHKVTPYVQGSKNDKNDSIAIAEAAGRPGIRAVPVKTVEQQNMMMLHSLRQQAVRQRTQKRNALRAHLSERGLTIRVGKSALYGLIKAVITPNEDGVIGSSCEVDGVFVSMLAKEYQNLCKLDQEVEDYDIRIKALVNGSEPMRRLMEIPGFGPITASSFVAAVGDGQAFKCGRVVSAWLGLTPRQRSTGGKPILLGISKRGNRYLRTMLVHGARSALRIAEAKEKTDPFSRWAREVAKRRGRHKAVLAIANKMARIGWVVLAKDVHYDPRLL
jgi:transposase